MVLFRSKFVPPPGGEYFFQLGNDSFRVRSYHEAERRTREIMAKHGVQGYPPEVLAKFMCPYMPDGYCTENFGNRVFTMDKQKDAALKYFSLPLEAYDVVEKRLDRCLVCPKHSRTFCLSCVGGLDWIRSMFRQARRILPVDRYAGTCTCAGTFASVVASIKTDALPGWGEDVPESCWRNDK